MKIRIPVTINSEEIIESIRFDGISHDDLIRFIYDIDYSVADVDFTTKIAVMLIESLANELPQDDKENRNKFAAFCTYLETLCF